MAEALDPEMVEFGDSGGSVKEASSDLPRPHYYVAAAPDMAEDMRQMLDDMGIDDDDIHSEDFTGYT